MTMSSSTWRTAPASPTTTRAASASCCSSRRASSTATSSSRGSGVEPLGAALDAAFLAQAFRGRAAPVKALLLDQRLIAGLGNIYVCEALHRSGISPLARRRAARHRGGQAHRRARAPAGRRSATCSGRRSRPAAPSLRDHRQADGSLGYFQHSFRVYDREGARLSDAGLHGNHRAARSSRAARPFIVPHCQK